MRFVCTADMRYVGQEYFVNMVVPHEEPISDRSVASMIERFHAAYQIRYGHSTPGAPLELVNLRVVAVGSLPGRIEGFHPAASDDLSHSAVESSSTASPTTPRSSSATPCRLASPSADRQSSKRRPPPQPFRRAGKVGLMSSATSS